MKSLVYHFRSKEIDEYNRYKAEVKKLEKKNKALRKKLKQMGIFSSHKLAVPSSSSSGTSPQQPSRKFPRKSNQMKTNNKSKRSSWTGVSVKKDWIVITLKEDTIPGLFLDRISKTKWIKFGNGTRKLDTLSRILRNETLLLKAGEDYYSLELPNSFKETLSSNLSKRNLTLFGDIKTTVWRKEGRITFNLTLRSNSND